MHKGFRPRPRRFRPAVPAILALSIVLSAGAYGLTAVPRSFDELVRLADTVIVGTVKEIRSIRADTPPQEIVSSVTFNALQVIKGRVGGEEYTLQVPGGVVGRYAEEYPGLPLFHTGQRYVLFVRGNQRDFFPVVGATQGVFRVMIDGRGREVVVRDDVAATARSLAPLTDAAPSLADFVHSIRARLPAANPP